MPASSPWPARLALAFLLLVLSGASVLLWRQIEAVQQKRVDERIGYQARSLARQLESTLHLEVATRTRRCPGDDLELRFSQEVRLAAGSCE